MTVQEHQAEHARQCAEALNYRYHRPPLMVIRPGYSEQSRRALWRRVLCSPLLWECLCLFFLSAAITWGLGG